MKQLTFILLASTLVVLSSCSSKTREEGRHISSDHDAHSCKQATTVINHNNKSMILETLHHGSLPYGVYKLTVDNNMYIYTQSTRGVALEFHGNVKPVQD